MIQRQNPRWHRHCIRGWWWGIIPGWRRFAVWGWQRFAVWGWQRFAVCRWRPTAIPWWRVPAVSWWRPGVAPRRRWLEISRLGQLRIILPLLCRHSLGPVKQKQQHYDKGTLAACMKLHACRMDLPAWWPRQCESPLVTASRYLLVSDWLLTPCILPSKAALYHCSCRGGWAGVETNGLRRLWTRASKRAFAVANTVN